MLGSIFSQASFSEPLERLFFTSEERAQLERSRLQNTDRRSNDNILTVNGIVQKDGGQRTAWINGIPQQVGKSDASTPASVPIDVPGISKPIKVKVGQRVLLNPSVDSED